MAINKAFVVKNGFEVSTNLIVADADTRRVGVGTTVALHTLHVNGGIGATNLFVSGITTLQQLNVSEIPTLGVTSATNLTSQQLNVSGISTFAGITTITGSTLFTKQLNVSGISTLGVTSTTNLTSQQLNVSGISTFGVTSTTNLTSQQLNVSGISTLGITSATNLTSQQLNVSGISTLGITSATNLTSQQLNVSGISTLGITSTTNLTSQQLNVSGISTLGVTSTTNLTSQQLNVSGISTLGITSTTNLTSQQLNVSGISTLGVTSTTNLTSQQLNVSGISTLGITSTTNLTSQQLNVSGISTLSITSATNLTSQQLNVSGISTLGVTSTTNLTSQQLNVSGISTLGVTSTTNLTSQQLNVSGISTLGTVKISSGIITASSGIITYFGDGSGLTNILNAGTATTTTNIPNLTGDITSVNTVTTLATVNSNTGIFGSQTSIPVVTVNAKGLVTAVSTAAVGTALTVAGDSGSVDINLLSETLTISGGINLTSVGSGNILTVNLDDNISLIGINATGISTLGITSSTNLTSQQLNVSGISTLGITSSTNLTSQQLNVSGISTFGAVGASGTTLFVNGDARITGIVTIGPASITLDGTTNIINVGTGITINGSTGIISATSIVLGGTTLTGAAVTSITAGSGISVDQSTGNVTITATGGGGGGSSQWITTNTGIHTLSNVGIGTTNPRATLNVVPASTSIAGLFSGTTSSDMVRITQLGSGSALRIEDEANPDATPFVVNASGSVGIGTVTPTSKLHVVGNERLTGSLFVSSSSQIQIEGSGGTYGDTAIELIGGSPSTLNFYARTATFSYDQFAFTAGSLSPVSTLDLGKSTSPWRTGYFNSIGIGTTNPTSALTVTGNALISGIITASQFVGDGSDLRNLSGTHIVSYASHSETSNSALSIAGISTYNQVGILTGSLAGDALDRFGNSVATSADGKTIIVGAAFDEIGATEDTGVVYVYDRVGSSFNQVGILTGSLAVDDSDIFGYSVATSADGKTIIVGAYADEQTGSGGASGVVYVFDRQGNSFNQVGILTGSLAGDTSDSFGYSVATSADGKTIVVGATFDEIGATEDTGVVYVYDRVGSSFNQVGILTGSLAGNTSDNFGNSVATSADGKTIIVGAYADEQTGSDGASGVVYVYDRVGSSFNQVGILTGSLSGDALDGFGYSVATSADGKTIIVGAYKDKIGATEDTGVVYVYDRVGSSFNQVGILTGSLAVDDSDIFGYSVATSADGKTIVVGAVQDEIGANTSTGVAYVFNRQGNSFNQVGILTGSLAGSVNDFFGYSVATSADGKTIVVGALTDEQTGSGGASGVVYVFDQTRDTYVHSGPTGSIGIGTTNPTSKLHVVGDARVGINTSQGVILTSANGTSYRLIVSNAGVLSTILVT